MTILMWDKPKKVMTVEQWAEHYGFDGGPSGGYLPNMSTADQLSWKAKITGKKLGFPQVEIRKTTQHGSQMVLIINLGAGYNYKYYRAVDKNMEEYSDLDDYINKEAEKYFKLYPKTYPTLEEAKASISRNITEKEFWENKYPTKGINVHIATNGPIQMTFEELQEMNDAIEEAKLALESLK